MDHFAYRDRTLFCEDVPVPELAEQYGTPLYVYSQATLLRHLNEVQTAFAAADPIVAYSVKSNGNLGICKLMAEHGSGFDVTSGGELYRALRFKHVAMAAAASIIPFGPFVIDRKLKQYEQEQGKPATPEQAW